MMTDKTVVLTLVLATLTDVFGLCRGSILRQDVNHRSIEFSEKGLPTFKRYMNYSEIEEYLLKLEKRSPELVTRWVIGKSSEGRDIHLFTISSKNPEKENKRQARSKEQNEIPVRFLGSLPGSPSSRNATNAEIILDLDVLKNTTVVGDGKRDTSGKPVILVDGGMHAREWVSPAAVVYLLESLLKDPAWTESLEWRIIPLLNPDGYKYSWEHDRLWRKTRSVGPTPDCYGVDINRNFDIHWMEEDSSADPCDEHYAGAYPFSEPETRALRDSAMEAKKNLKAYVTVHNWGQVILYPYGWSIEETPKTYEETKRIGERMAEAIRQNLDVNYSANKSSVALYMSSGTSKDWMTDNMPGVHAYNIELRDEGQEGFFLGEQFIETTGKELWTSMKQLAKEILFALY